MAHLSPLRASGRPWRRLAQGLLGCAAAFFLAGLFLGLRADTEARVPATPAEGIVSQVCQPPGQARHARCAVVVAHPLEEVWTVLTDYEHYGDICSSIHSAEVIHDPSGPTVVKAEGDTFLGGRLPFAVRIEHQCRLDRYTVAWSDAGGNVRNRGRWVLTPRSPAETLVELEQEVEVWDVPAAFVRALLLPRLCRTVVALQQRLADGPSGNPW